MATMTNGMTHDQIMQRLRAGEAAAERDKAALDAPVTFRDVRYWALIAAAAWVLCRLFS